LVQKHFWPLKAKFHQNLGKNKFLVDYVIPSYFQQQNGKKLFLTKKKQFKAHKDNFSPKRQILA
jgi:hypothetical protein